MRDKYEDSFESESDDDDYWGYMGSVVHKNEVPKVEEMEEKKEVGQKSLEKTLGTPTLPLGTPTLPLKCAHGVDEEYPWLHMKSDM